MTTREAHQQCARYITHLLAVNPTLDPHCGVLRDLAQDLWDGKATLPFPRDTPPFEGVTP